MSSSRRKLVVRPSDVAVEVADYEARIIAAGGTISAPSLLAVGVFVAGCKAGGLWSKLVDVGVFAGNSLTAALVKLKYPTGTGLLTNFNFVGGDYTEATGLNGNGTTKYLTTGINFQDSINSAYGAFGFYTRAAMPGGGAASALGADELWLGTNHDGGTLEADYFTGEWMGGSAPISAKSAAGFYACVVEQPEQIVRLYDKDGLCAPATVTAGGAQDHELFVFCRNNTSGAGAEEFWTGRLSFYFFSYWLTANEVALLYNLVQALQTALGREV